MNLAQIIKTTERISLKTKERRLTDAEIIALKAAWEDIGYEEAIRRSGGAYSESYVRSDAGRKLWLTLSEYFGKKINKASLRSYFENHPEFLTTEKNSSSILGGYPPVIEDLIGRQSELKELQHLSKTEQCIFINGIAGVGKTCLAAKAISEIHQQSSRFKYYVWLPVHYKPSLFELLDCLMGYLGGATGPTYQKNRSSAFIQFLQRHQCLIVLDEADSMVGLESSQESSEYQSFVRRLIEEQHQSCVLMTSRTLVEELSRYKSVNFPCENMHLAALTPKEVQQLVESQDITFDDDWAEMVASCMGNPQLLHSVLRKVSNLLGGQPGLVNQKTSLALNEFEYRLDKIFVNATDIKDLEILVLCQIATFNGAQRGIPLIPFAQAIAEKHPDISELDVLNSVERLQRHNLLSLETNDGFSEIIMGSILKKYIMREFFEKIDNTPVRS